MIGFLALIFTALSFFSPAYAQSTQPQLSPWYSTANTVRTSTTTGTVRVPFLANCNTIDTDANGVFSCGTDATGAGGGSGSIATSTNETAGRLAYWTSTSATPATLGEVATTTLTATSPLSFSATVLKVGGSNSVLSIATTSTSLFSGSAGQVLAFINGGWFGVATTTAGTGLTYTGTAFNVDLGTAITSTEITDNEILEADLKVVNTPNDEEFFTYESTTGDFEWHTCTEMLGAGLCDGEDATAAGAADPFVWETTYSTLSAATSSALWSQLRLFASSTMAAPNQLDYFSALAGTTTNATSTNLNISGTLDVDGITSALGLFGAGGILAEYAGTSCTNQVPTALSAAGAATCTSVSAAFLADGDWGEITIATNNATIDDNVIESEHLGDDDWGDITIASNAASVEDDSHAHTSSSLSGIDISADTNLTAGDGLTLNDDDVDLDIPVLFSFGGTGTTTNRYTGIFYGTGSILTQASTTGLLDYDPTPQRTTIKNASTTDLTIAGVVIPPYETLGFTYATTSWVGTTTIFLGPAAGDQTFDSVSCETDVGTIGVSFHDGTNRATPYIPTASTTINTNVLTANNTFTKNESRRVDLGTPASSPKKVACTAKFRYLNDL